MRKLATNPLRPVLIKLQQQANDSDAILFCGDFTTLGSKEGYEKCVNWLEKALGLHGNKHWQPDRVHVVMGNHANIFVKSTIGGLSLGLRANKLAKFGLYQPTPKLIGKSICTT